MKIDFPTPCYRSLAHGGMSGSLWNAAVSLNAGISYASVVDASELDELVWHAFPTMQAIRDFHEAHLAASWPGSFGESPVHHVADIASCFMRAHDLSRKGLQRGAHERRERVLKELVSRWGAPALKRRFDVRYDDAERLWPRLHWAAKQAAILTDGEASSALVIWYRLPLVDRKSTGSSIVATSEAVGHFGGVRELLSAARRWRRRFVFGGTYPRRRPQPMHLSQVQRSTEQVPA